MIVIADTRETLPLDFKSSSLVSCVLNKKLDFGDYACIYEPSKAHPFMSNIVFERKAIGDLFSSFGYDPSAETKKIKKAKESGAEYIIIVEAPDGKIAKGYKYAPMYKTSGLSLIKKLDTISRKYGVQVMYCSNRTLMTIRMINIWSADGKIQKDFRTHKKTD